MRALYCDAGDPELLAMAASLARDRRYRHKRESQGQLNEERIPFRAKPCECGNCPREYAFDDFVMDWLVGNEACNAILEFQFGDNVSQLKAFIPRWREYQKSST